MFNHDHSRFCSLELARQEARHKITTLLNIYTTTDDPYEHEVLAHVLRIGNGYVQEIKHQRDTGAIPDPEHYKGLELLRRYAMQSIAAIALLPATARGLYTIASLLSDAAAFLKATIDAASPANLEAEV
jgi:hypothetical protein